MNRTKIPWADYTINPVKGLCPMSCSYCYARRMYKRFKWNPEIKFDMSALSTLVDIWRKHETENVRIFVGSTMELFGDWVNPKWVKIIFRFVALFPEYTFIFLTKQPQNLIRWSPFPKNCWVGISVTSNGDMTKAYYGLEPIKATIKFISFEPLLSAIGMNDHVNIKNYLDWLIIGSQTQPVKHPKEEWVTEIIEAADKARIPVFIKEPLASYIGIQRQEFPAGANTGTW